MSNTTLGVPSSTLEWLHASLSGHYIESNRVYHDVVHTLAAHKSLSPRTETYTSEYGLSSLLLVLKGTVPASFQGNIYHFPLAIWIPTDYPHQPPLVFVTPNERFVTRPGQYVSIDGKVFHPYLAAWTRHTHTSDILSLLRSLQQAFATDPPLVARQRLPQHPKNESMPEDAAGRLRHEASSQAARHYGSFNSQRRSQSDLAAPEPPPKPVEIQSSRPNVPRPRPPAESGQNVQGIQMPLIEQHIHPLHDNSFGAYHGAAGQQSAASFRDVHMSSVKTLPNQSVDSNKDLRDAGTSPASGKGPSNQSIRPQSYAIASPYQVVQQPWSSGTNLDQPLRPHSNIQQESILPVVKQREKPTDLLSSAMDYLGPALSSDKSVVAPPIPRNPEKHFLLGEISKVLRKQLEQYLSTKAMTVPALHAQRKALSETQRLIQSEVEELHRLNSQLSTNDQILHDAVHGANLLIENVGERDAPSVDDMLVAPTMVGQQLYKLVADERSTADAIFGMTRALDKGRLQDDVFVKQVRSLAREQFLLKALIKKISEGMGLLLTPP